MSKKAEIIEKYGEDAYKRQLAQQAAYNTTWRAANPGLVTAGNAKSNPELCHKGGKYYEKKRIYQITGIQHLKELVRGRHQRLYKNFKRIVDPLGLTQIHHEYLNDGTANYQGVALVEKNQHLHGIIDVIQILEGKITLFTEKEIMEERDR